MNVGWKCTKCGTPNQAEAIMVNGADGAQLMISHARCIVCQQPPWDEAEERA